MWLLAAPAFRACVLLTEASQPGLLPELPVGGVQSRKMQRISAHLQRMVQLAPMMYLEDRNNWILHVSKELGTSKQRISE